MTEDGNVWPPTPKLPQPPGQEPKLRTPHLVTILVMWALTIGQMVLQVVGSVSILSKVLGIAGFGLALFLVTRPAKAARINGGLRLVLTVLGVLTHLTAGK